MSAARRVLAEQYDLLFGRGWPVWGAALLVGTLNVFLFAFDRPWTASDGARHWGDWLVRSVGLLDRPGLVAPWLYSGSLLNLGVLAGAFASALLSREFAIRVAPPGELAKGAVGGFLMGVGAMLAFGCNIGGFFSALSALSLSGFPMMVGLGAGAYLGLRYLLWELERWPRLSAGRSFTFGAARPAGLGWQPALGALVFLALLGLPVLYGRLGYAPQAGFLLFGLAFGLIFQRSRFCLVRAFREPFMSGEGEHTRATALALVVSMVGFSILKLMDLKDRSDWVFPGFWLGALLGGLLFGVGMVLAGGCGAGAIWRAGEGHVKLWLAVGAFALGTTLTRQALVEWELLRRLGQAVFLPSVVGWGGAMGLVALVMLAWYLFAAWNESTRKWSLV
jgi:uncharacterized membrane protein YedE/YeeE